MCGRYNQNKEFSEVAIRFNSKEIMGWNDQLFRQGRDEIFPTQIVPVLLNQTAPVFRLMSWGLVPSWAKDQKIGNKMINARSETLMKKPSFKRLLPSKRCIVPATGFYEWKKNGRTKTKMEVRLKGGDLFGFAGLWDRWVAPNGEGRDCYSFTIITTVPNELIAPIHDRMPVILKREDEDGWLDPGLKDPWHLSAMLRPYPAIAMEAYET